MSTLARECPHCRVSAQPEPPSAPEPTSQTDGTTSASGSPERASANSVDSEVSIEAVRAWLEIQREDDVWLLEDAQGKHHLPMTLGELLDRFAGQHVRIQHPQWAAPRTLAMPSRDPKEPEGKSATRPNEPEPPGREVSTSVPEEEVASRLHSNQPVRPPPSPVGLRGQGKPKSDTRRTEHANPDLKGHRLIVIGAVLLTLLTTSILLSKPSDSTTSATENQAQEAAPQAARSNPEPARRCTVERSDYLALERLAARLRQNYEGFIHAQNQLYAVGLPIDLGGIYTILSTEPIDGSGFSIALHMQGQFMGAQVWGVEVLNRAQMNVLEARLGLSRRTVTRLIHESDFHEDCF